MSNTLDNARGLIESRLAEINDERKRLERALKSLTSDAVSRAPGRPKATASSAPVASKPARRRRRKGVDRQAQITKIITDQPGLKASEIARAAGVSSQQAHGILAKLIKAGTITKAADKTYSPAASS